jgi:GTP-sensing pleiotropic transcriptional regulator CodY
MTEDEKILKDLKEFVYGDDEEMMELEKKEKEFERRKKMYENMAINIVLDDLDAPRPIFVEIETDKGESINIGTNIRRSDGLASIRITVEDIIKHIKI